jgi:hypothetical protein
MVVCREVGLILLCELAISGEDARRDCGGNEANVGGGADGFICMTGGIVLALSSWASPRCTPPNQPLFECRLRRIKKKRIRAIAANPASTPPMIAPL